jgi:GTP-binding protein HflX
LIEAFKATLEESSEADVLLHVIDLSSPNMQRQIEVVENLIKEFQWEHKKIIHVFNKVDIAPVDKQFQVREYPRVFLSAATGQGVDTLKKMMADTINEIQTDAELFFPKRDEYKIFDLSRDTHIVRKEPATEGTICHVQMSPLVMTRWKDYLVK